MNSFSLVAAGSDLLLLYLLLLFYLVECFENLYLCLYLRLYMIMNLYLYFWLTTCCNPSWEQAVACHESDLQTPARMIETDMLPFLIQCIKTDHESYLHTRLCMMSVDLLKKKSSTLDKFHVLASPLSFALIENDSRDDWAICIWSLDHPQ